MLAGRPQSEGRRGVTCISLLGIKTLAGFRGSCCLLNCDSPFPIPIPGPLVTIELVDGVDGTCRGFRPKV
eukprot:5885209-Prymnesium_polylepis.1